MQPEQEPAVKAETVSAVNESPAVEQTVQPSVTPEAVVQPQNNEVDEWRKRAEEAEKKANQAAMRANQLENERKEAERKALEEANEYKTLYERQQEEIREREERETAEKALADARTLRNTVIDSYTDESVKKAAKALLAKNDNNFWWDGNLDEPEAKAAVQAQLDELRGVIGTPDTPPEPPVIDGNNPLGGRDNTPAEDMKVLDAKYANVRF